MKSGHNYRRVQESHPTLKVEVLASRLRTSVLKEKTQKNNIKLRFSILVTGQTRYMRGKKGKKKGRFEKKLANHKNLKHTF